MRDSLGLAARGKWAGGKLRLVFLIAAALLHGHGASAHHAGAAVFDYSKRMSVAGTVVKVDWFNPHAHFYVDVSNKDGVVEQWSFELNSPNEMMRAGWRRDTVKAGDKVTVEYAPSRSHPNQAWAWFVMSADGRKLLTTDAAF